MAQVSLRELRRYRSLFDRAGQIRHEDRLAELALETDHELEHWLLRASMQDKLLEQARRIGLPCRRDRERCFDYLLDLARPQLGLFPEGPAPNRRYPDVYFEPPKAAYKWARWGLEARKNAPRSKKGGLSTREAGKQGIGSGVARARDILAGKRLNAYQVKAFFDRHEHNYEPAIKRAKKRAKAEGIALKVAAEDEPSVQSWWQWGGEPARRGAEKAVRAHERVG